jgi:hypothetical protein
MRKRHPLTLETILLTKLGEALYARGWRRCVADELGIHLCTVTRWMEGTHGSPSADHIAHMLAVVRQRYTTLRKLHDDGLEALRLRQPPPPPPRPPPPPPNSIFGGPDLPVHKQIDGLAPKPVSNLHGAPRGANGRLLPTGKGSRPTPRRLLRGGHMVVID